MESQTRGPLHGGQADDEPKPPRWLGAGEDPNPATQALMLNLKVRLRLPILLRFLSPR